MIDTNDYRKMADWLEHSPVKNSDAPLFLRQAADTIDRQAALIAKVNDVIEYAPNESTFALEDWKGMIEDVREILKGDSNQ